MSKKIESGSEFVAHWLAETARLDAQGMYAHEDEKDSCGVGLVAAIDGSPRREVVRAGIDALKAVWHRGAVDADGKTGDGAGIHIEIPQDFFTDHVRATGHAPSDRGLAVGMVFLPRTDFGQQEACRTVVEQEILNFGFYIYGWRQVPVDISVIGEKANATRPEIEQIMIEHPADLSADEFERKLFIIRRRIERRALEANLSTDFYLCSLSCRSLIYKGMFLAADLENFYPDLTDERFVSSFAIYHQRYSTNTFPKWKLAQPFRMLAHNGEINTWKGNVNWMKSHEIRMVSEAFGEYSDDIKPVIQPGGSDSSSLDNVFEVLVRAGRSAPLAKTFLVPEAWSKKSTMPDAHRAMYAYVNSVMEPWDGPAALAMTDGRWIVGGLDRNGLRPMRYTITRDGLLVMGSETGMVLLSEADIVEKGALGPGQMIAVDLGEGRLYHDREMKDKLAAAHPYVEWTKSIVELDEKIRPAKEPVPYERAELRMRQLAAGMSHEDMELILQPMVEDGKEAIGSMGDDAPLAVLSEKYRPLHHYFRQNFSQVTNPPIDPLREHRVMSLKTRFGNLKNVLAQDSSQANVLVLESPVVSSGELLELRKYMGDSLAEIDCTFPAKGGPDALKGAVARIRQEAEDAVRQGYGHLILSDEAISDDRAAIPMVLAVGGIHSHLVRRGLRTFTSLNVRSGECLDTHMFAVLIGCGATTVNAYLAEACIADRLERGLFPGLSHADCIARFKESINQGLLKIMSKMGISVVSSYRGGYNFEAVGLSRALVAEFFPGMQSRISGIGLPGIQKKVLELHARAFDAEVASLPVGGLYRFRKSGELHAWEGGLVHLLQQAVSSDSYTLYKKYSQGIHARAPISLRDLLEFKPAGVPIPIEDVESITSIRKRFVTPGMSLGALSAEAHETLTIAMNRIGAKADSGEGGEGRERFTPRANGDNANSPIKQVASGRFGVTAEYLNQARELEIKVAQGAKPGEGGQLPGFKATVEIARLRHSTPGVTLISPPPHHDIYSIEDLAQLIYDLKQINPTARVCVKLVAGSGIGTIAAGVAKAKADVILISGHVGGTGASPQTSIKYAGLPWEMGLTEANQVLTLNRLRHSVTLRTDGGIKTGRDVVMAALMGAEEYGVGTASLVALGCIMVRQCQSNTCPVGVCTQDPAMREKFDGSAEKVVNLFSFIAEEVREVLASLGLRSLDEAIGRVDLLRQVSRGHHHLDDLDLNPLLVTPDSGPYARHSVIEGRNEVPETLDAQMVKDAAAVFERGEKMQLTYSIRNTQRAIGTRLSSHVVRKFGMDGLDHGHIEVSLRGSGGQSLGAFAVKGVKLKVYGDANDYVGKGLSGGTIVVRTTTSSPLVPQENTIIGNTVLYGATAGYLFAGGKAGERFAVRNSGATTVIEGCGSNGCEYMTGGTAVILGPVGDNFGAGMSGGMAFLYDPHDDFPMRVNDETVVFQRLASAHWEGVLKELVERHMAETGSPLATRLLSDWEREIDRFWQVCPKEMIKRLAHPLSDESALKTA
ncbi:glutamate synthase large subunit [Zavarzinia compransoris]|uniref:glutamate synthase large subunit n=1 Tax=Zavarzinia marina TaxID=2911065 RepID=UPI001F45AAA7|nr:glutamate synthase large subunit [Zavarzinia marina]MCF4165990.1 glutamate synthase large subunit [Zavarzinia marina]